ncbi:MAG: NAD(P)-dependent oxidoreductase, partial [Deltaproteobacteria bacterium]|nr:NAD(P)-dependent oxidoreductase [Deltaproteobacteria bacterium]
GFSVTGYDIVKKAVADLVQQGMKPAASPGAAVEGAELIILSLPNWKILQEVVAGKDGLIGAVRRGQIIADMSTSPPEGTIAMARTMAAQGVDWMDIPISGSSAQARVGNMVFMAGGKKSVFNRVKPVLDRIGKKSVYAGKHGDGAMLKLVVNLILYLNEAAAVEGLALGMKAGLDPDIMLDVITTGAASSDLIMARGKDMLAGRFSPKGQVSVAVKDMGLIVERARQLGVMLPVGGLYQQILLQAQYRGWDQEDATAVLKIYEQWAGIARSDR